MKRKLLTLICVLICFTASAQLPKVVENLIDATKKEVPATPPTDSVVVNKDSILIEHLKQQIQEMRMNEIVLSSEVAKTRSDTANDSIKQAQHRSKIDSLRLHAKGFPVVIEGDTLFRFYAKMGGLSIEDRALRTTTQIIKMGETRSVKADSTKIVQTDDILEISNNGTIIVTVTSNDALWMNVTQDSLAIQYRNVVVQTINSLQEKNSILQLLFRILKFVLVLVLQYLLFRFTTFLFLKIKKFIVRAAHNKKLKPIRFNDYEFLNTIRQARILVFFSNVIRYALVLVQLLFSVPMLFAIFPQTEELADRIFGYLMSPVLSISNGLLDYFPNLFFIGIIWLSTSYVVKGVQYVAKEVESERLTIPGFYPDWSQSTFNIIRFLLYAFMIAMIYPYLPGSGSGAVQGISVFVGLIVSLGSSTVIANIIAGMIITYMRPFKIGDRIKLGDTIGNVIEKTPFVTRIKTPKNEIITIPNGDIMSAHTTNYSESARNFGLIIHTTVTIGYDTPWPKIHKLLIDAAKITDGVSASPEPFVLETSLEDFYPVYQINAYIKDANRMASIYSELHQNIQNKFDESGIKIESPAVYVRRD